MHAKILTQTANRSLQCEGPLMHHSGVWSMLSHSLPAFLHIEWSYMGIDEQA